MDQNLQPNRHVTLEMSLQPAHFPAMKPYTNHLGVPTTVGMALPTRSVDEFCTGFQSSPPGRTQRPRHSRRLARGPRSAMLWRPNSVQLPLFIVSRLLKRQKRSTLLQEPLVCERSSGLVVGHGGWWMVNDG